MAIEQIETISNELNSKHEKVQQVFLKAHAQTHGKKTTRVLLENYEYGTIQLLENEYKFLGDEYTEITYLLNNNAVLTLIFAPNDYELFHPTQTIVHDTKSLASVLIALTGIVPINL